MLPWLHPALSSYRKVGQSSAIRHQPESVSWNLLMMLRVRGEGGDQRWAWPYGWDEPIWVLLECIKVLAGDEESCSNVAL
jgi:hypothetical protein